jgi:hypothetical protein
MRMSFPRPKTLNAAEQKFGLELSYPEGSASLNRTRLIWRQKVQPSIFSRVYELQVEYQPGGHPTTWVVKPSLRSLAGDRKIPHVYPRPDDPLCLYYSSAHEWNGTMSLAKTIIPWACEWLFHFEAWLYTNEWDGGGVHI